MAEAKSYKQLSQELADIIAWFESEDIDLDAAITKYEKAVTIIEKMEKFLNEAENKIKKVTSKLE
jgi:exodeoxyribonuclease VII small subunit